MSEHRLQDLRTDYARASLDVADVLPDPIAQLEKWMHEAVAAEVVEPTAMTLATATPSGKPSARIVLCKKISPDGVEFFTNYESRKGEELEANSQAAIVFYWGTLERQVRLEGEVSRVSHERSCAYFESRPRASRIGAWASAQSRVVASRADLTARFAEMEARYKIEDPPLPPYWGGYVLAPHVMEFWQGRKSRMHDRVQYTRDILSGVWSLARLCP